MSAQSMQWRHLANLELADPAFTTPRPVDLIIGADVFGKIIRPGIKKQTDSMPIALSTIFGWIVLGPVQHSDQQEWHTFHTSVVSSDQEIQDLLTKFWIQEEVDHSINTLSSEEQSCEDHFRATHTRDEDRRYVVRIPLKSTLCALGESRITAHRCLFRLQRRFLRNESYKLLYTSFMREYLELGHMRPAPVDRSTLPVTESSSSGSDGEMTLAHAASAAGGQRVSSDLSSGHSLTYPYYLPHHGVLKESSATTKLRVVFNGSSPSSTGISINDLQHVGPKVQRDISDVLIWIRQFKYIFATDITKMYRQIKVHKDDWDLQRIMWIDDHQKEVPYQLTTVTYGTRSAPFLAIRALLQLVEDEGHRFPLASKPLLHGRYVDDIFGGADELPELLEVSDQVTQLCAAGGFPLAKWHSKSKHFMDHISDPSHSDPISFEDSDTKLLGLSWTPHTDQLKFLSKHDSSSPTITKRIILSETAQLFDPLGFLAPFIIRAKILLQELWLEKLAWGDQVSPRICTKWKMFREELRHVSSISIPRWIQTSGSSTVEFHGFSDASQVAMAAVIYIKTTDAVNGSRVTLLCSKSKVAPLKRMSIPRLELTAALILAKLMRYGTNLLNFPNAKTFMWTDSSVTLTWISSHSSKWKDFVRNSVAAIQDLTPRSMWRFVPGKVNPADCASRGLSISQLQKHDLWWTGPPWLLTDQQYWPKQSQPSDSRSQEEERPGLSFVVAAQPPKYHWDLILNYSSMTRLLRVTAIWFRVSQIIKKLPHPTLRDPITPHEMHRSRVFWTKATQAAFFAHDIKLISNQGLPPSHPLRSLTAFVDTEGILRVGGRLKNAPLDIEAIHPAILPRHSHFTELVIAEAHQRTMHGGAQITLNQIRRTYWIVGGRQSVRSYILRCVTCARQRGVRAQQLMGQLPASRFTPSRAFYTSGVDYAGPIQLKSTTGRGARISKGWMCVFVCFFSSAVHLEAVSDYSTDGFISAFRRFTGRRGICHTLHSDCGTNFVGADASLKALFKQGTQEFNSLAATLSNDCTTWRFNPPASPHMGGKWEAAVKSVKHHLKRTVGDAPLTYEELSTLLVEIEAILNSRPLEPLTDDPDDISALTPAHFLVGEPLTAAPEPSLLDVRQNRLSRWQFIQQRLQCFWTKWAAQYLQRHLAVSKWHHPSHQLKVGSLVLITDERLPPGKWPLARITAVHPGKDGLVRVATLKTATSSLTRPITKLAILPIEAENCSPKKTE